MHRTTGFNPPASLRANKFFFWWLKYSCCCWCFYGYFFNIINGITLFTLFIHSFTLIEVHFQSRKHFTYYIHICLSSSASALILNQWIEHRMKNETVHHKMRSFRSLLAFFRRFFLVNVFTIYFISKFFTLLLCWNRFNSSTLKFQRFSLKRWKPARWFVRVRTLP